MVVFRGRQSLETFWVDTGIRWVETRDAAALPTMPRVASRTKGCLVHSVDKAKRIK